MFPELHKSIQINIFIQHFVLFQKGQKVALSKVFWQEGHSKCFSLFSTGPLVSFWLYNRVFFSVILIKYFIAFGDIVPFLQHPQKVFWHNTFLTFE